MEKLKLVFDFEQIKTVEDVKWVLSVITGVMEVDVNSYNGLGDKRAFFKIVPPEGKKEEEIIPEVEQLPLN